MDERIQTTDNLSILDIREAHETWVKELVKKRQKQTQFEQYGIDGNILQRYDGVPGGTKIVIAQDTVFRHYTTIDFYPNIIGTSKLLSGKIPYAMVSTRFRAYWDDLKGIFVTNPNYEAKKVGVGDRTYYLDFTLDPKVLLLQIEEAILLIPNIGDQKIEVPINIQKTGENV